MSQSPPISRQVFMSIAALFMAGCVADAPWNRERQSAVTIALMPASPAVVLAAAEKAVREISPRSTTFDFSPSGFQASRTYSAYFVVAAMQGIYLYQVKVDPAPGGAQIEIKIYASSTSITAAGAIPAGTTMWQDDDAYRLLQDRIRFHAGLTADWISCEEAKALYDTRGAIEPVCLDARASDPQ